MAGAVNERSERSSSMRSSALESPRTRPSREVEVWGVLNVTPDSFSDGGLCMDPEAALSRARAMLDEGADVIDVGGASSRPRGATYGEGALAVEVDEELRRVVPVIASIVRAAPGAIVSIDTTSGAVAEAAIEAGARIVNDVSMGRDPSLVDACARSGAELVLMHTRLDGRVDGATTGYRDVVSEVIDELGRAVERAVELGVRRERVWIDPGLGFAKTATQSMTLLAATAALVATGQRVLVGASRKSFLAVSGVDEGERVPEPTARLGASLAAATLAALAGAHAVRVHDVRDTRQAVRVARRARAMSEVGRAEVAR
jgi:dihydropteroate synthase